MTIRSLSRRLTVLLTAAAMIAGGSAAARAQTFSEPQRAEIGAILKDYLLRNPEILQEAFAELEKRQQAAQKTAQASALKDMRAGLARAVQVQAGNPSGDVTMVEFFDYNCGYCKRALSDVQGLVKADPKLRVVLKDLPVLGPDSVEASRIAVAVSQQLSGDRLFDYHVRLLSSRGRVGGERALAVAKEMGVDLARVQRDVEGPIVKATLQENGALGERLGLNGTPAFIVGDEVIAGAVGLDPLRQAITSVRRCGQATC